MWALFLKAVPFRDYLYAAAAIAAVAWYNVHVHNLEVAYGAKQKAAVVEAVDKASAEAQNAARKLAEAKEQQYTIQLSQVEESYENQLKSADAQHAADLSRVRQLTAQNNRNTDGVLHGAGGAETSGSCGALCVAALGAGASLADALRRDDDALTACYKDRDNLTGK